MALPGVHILEREATETHANEIKMEVLRSDVNNLTPGALESFVSDLERKMGLNCKGDRFAPLTSGFRHFFRDDELDASGMPTNVDLDRIVEQKRRFVNLFSEMYHRSGEINIRENPTVDVNGDEFRLGYRITRLIETVDDAYEIIFRYVRSFERINHPTYVPVKGDMDHSLFRCKTLDQGEEKDDEPSPYQKLLLFLLNQTYIMKFRRYGDHCCKQVTTPAGHLTKAWKEVMEIKDFVYHYSQKEDKYDMWRNMTARGGNVSDTIKHLTNCKDLQFPTITKNRHVWSFHNGLFVGKEWKNDKFVSRFYEYNSPEFKTLDPTIVSSRYFDLPFDPYTQIADWYDIPTPNMQHVMGYQRFSDDVCRWLYVFCGRLCFDVNDMDRWQVMPFLKGIAGSGKSTIVTKICGKFYEGQDVRTLSNNIEKKFGLESVQGGFMFISPEIKGDMALEQAEFQSLVSGEDMSIARKCKSAVSIKWKTPGMLAGNEVPNWKDNSGSVLRRILAWNFAREVTQADPQLDSKLELELPAILCKCIRAYLEYSQKYSDKDIWNVVPQYFKNVQTQVAMVTNTLRHFLASEKVRFGKDLCVPQKVFINIFNQHCQENNLGRPRFNPDFYAGPFSSKEIEVRTHTATYKGAAYASQPFIFGVDIMDQGVVADDAY
jgi:hypothetical protein